MSVAASFFRDGICLRKLTFLSLIDLVWELERNEDLGKGGHHNLNIILFAHLRHFFFLIIILTKDFP